MPDQRTGFVSIQAADTTACECIDMDIDHFAEGFRMKWVFVHVGHYSPLPLTPSSPTVPSSRWEHAPLTDPRLSLVRGRLETLKEAVETLAPIVREFLMRLIALLQCHSRPMWSFSGPNDPMRLHPGHLSADTLDGVLWLLLGKSVGGLPHGGALCTITRTEETLLRRCPAWTSEGCFPEATRGLGTRVS
ncbi:hypothetical protein D1007_45027 [Hordeum vulgare]|nr:hypothetical protein D1007_45027 [Hordeum vulgare]